MGWWGSLRDLSKNILKQGWVKAKVVRWGGRGFEGVTIPAPPENFNHTPVGSNMDSSNAIKNCYVFLKFSNFNP